ncbi:MAG: glycosyltransferase family 4 protein [Aggregatilineales bacterium]
MPVWFEGWSLALNPADPPRAESFEYDALCVGNSRDPRTVEAMDWFFEQVYPRLRHLQGAAQTWRIGIFSVHPDAPLKWCKVENVECGDVILAEDILSLYRRSRMLIVPTQTGGSIHLKILNAFASGCPVVMTSTANDGIAAEHGVQVLLADQPEAFAQCMLQLRNNPEQSVELARAGRAWIKTYVQDGLHALEALYQRAQPAADLS